MRLELDENLHPDAAELLERHGHDALTVHDQRLRGHPDETVAAVSRREQRALVSLDLDFSDVRAYPPHDYHGIVVLRLTDQSRPALLQVLTRTLPLFDTEQLAGTLWMVDERHVRVRGG